MAVHKSGMECLEQLTRKKLSGARSSSIPPMKTDNKHNSKSKGFNTRKRASLTKTDEQKEASLSNTSHEQVAAKTNEKIKRHSRSESKELRVKPSLDANENKTNRDSSRHRRLDPQKKLHNDTKGVVSCHDKDCEASDLDFSTIEQKIFEGFPLGNNFDRGSLKKEKTKKKMINSLPASSQNMKTNTRSSKHCPVLDKKNVPSKRSHNSPAKINKKREKDVNLVSKSSIPRDLSKGKISKPVTDSKNRSVKSNKKTSVTASDSDVSDWEEVNEMEGVNEIEELLTGSHLAKAKPEGVQIELDAPDVLWGIRRRKKRTEEEMIEDYLRKRANRSIKVVHENMHKVHLLSLFAFGRHVNKILNSEELLGAALSIITDKKAYPPKRLDFKHLEVLVGWFSKKITVKPEDMEDDYWSHPLKQILAVRFEMKKACSNQELVFMFVVLCRALGINTRLVLSLQPMSWKPSMESLIKPPKKGEKKTIAPEPSCSWDTENSQDNLKKQNNNVKRNNRKMLSSDSEVESKGNKGSGVKKINKKENIQKRKSLSDDGEDSDFDLSYSKIKKGPKLQRQRRSDKRNSMEGNENTDKRKFCGKVGDVEGKRRKGEPFVEWIEVHVEEEEKWVCIDVTRAKIHCIVEIEARMPAGSAYITAYNANLTVKDVTRRYVSSWLSSENKIRCCSKWWEESLKPFKGQRTRLDKEEDKEMDQILQEQPLPRSIGEYKNHPLYALQRHLLKFEAIYPPDVSPVGFIRSEPIYPRDSVYNLHSRDTWVKEAKTVRVGEEPYKVVKARPKWDKVACKVIKDIPLELFGEWQVEDYEPPVASGGKVPRNEYGNVELFKPSMLPKGCVHIPIAGLNRVARKLNIDCAPAMVGFDFHSGWTHPVYDGYVICEEFKHILLDAWNQEQTEQAKRAEEKKQKRIYDNWRRLIQGILVKERVRKKYGNTSQSDEEEKQMQKETVPKKMEEKKKEITKRKIKQKDIDAIQPPLITHQINTSLSIDFSSSVVEMAEKSRRRTMTTKNSVKRDFIKRKMTDKDNKNDLPDSDSENELDDDKKKEKIRAILQWGNEAVMPMPDLSDDSDVERDSQPSSHVAGLQFSNPFHSSKIKASMRKQGDSKGSKLRKRTKESTKQNSSDSECVTDVSTSRSTTPEPKVENVSNLGYRRTSRRFTKQKVKTYKESEGESGADISVDESDCEDKSYDPKKGERIGTHVLNMNEGSETD